MTSTFPHWIYDNSEIPDAFGFGERAVEFLRRLKHPKNPARGHPFQLDPWHERIVRRIYGPRHEDGRRIVETALLLVPRGNRKTSLAAALGLLHSIGPEHIPAGEVLFAAADKKQAAIGFKEALSIVRADKRVNAAVKVSDAVNATKRLTLKSDDSFLETLSSDTDTQHGRTPVFALVDEIHAHKKRDLYDVIRTGLTKTKGSLLVVATTSGRGEDSIGYDLVSYARKVAHGEIDNPAFLPILFEADPNEDWQDEALWHRVNPGLVHGYPSIEGLRTFAKEAIDRPGDREAFKQLHLNMWLEKTTGSFVDLAIYDEGAAPIDVDDLLGQPCWIGVDMSRTTDLTAVVAAFCDDDGNYTVLPFFFLPQELLRERQNRDRQPYVRWAEEGFITATPGNVVDDSAVEACIRDLCERFDVQEIDFDEHYAQKVMQPLTNDGFPTATLRQGWKTQGPALNVLESAIVGRKFRHGGNPVLRMCFANVAVYTDSAGNRTGHKGKSIGRIDGFTASWMAVSRAAANATGNSIYDSDERENGLLILEDLFGGR